MRRTLYLFAVVLLGGACPSAKSPSETGDSGETCPPEYSEVTCCDFDLGELTTCWCIQEDCEAVLEYGTTDDGGCTEPVYDLL